MTRPKLTDITKAPQTCLLPLQNAPVSTAIAVMQAELELLRTGSEEARTMAAGALWKLAGAGGGFPEAISRGRAFSALVALLRSDSLPAQRNAAGLLGVLAVSLEVKNQIARAGKDSWFLVRVFG